MRRSKPFSFGFRLLATALGMVFANAAAAAKTELVVTIGTQNTTTNTVTAGAVLKELKLLEKHLPKTGKYANVAYKIDWQNFTSGPPITNGMIANRIQIGSMGDYPLLFNGAVGQQQKGSETLLVAVVAYNLFGAGNGVVVHKDSPYYELADLRGKRLSVPFGSAAHGMLLQAMQEHGWPANFWSIANQSPEVGSTNLQEKRIDAHAGFVPFMELLPYRGFARKIFDGVQTRVPTMHGVTVRKDFAEKYPEVVVGFIRAMMEANDWVRRDPQQAAERIAAWTRIEREVVYSFLGPGGIHTLDPTIKPRLVEALGVGRDVLVRLDRIKSLDFGAWIDERYVKRAFAEQKLDYERQKMTAATYEVRGRDAYCGRDITRPRESGQIWPASGAIRSYASPNCTLAAASELMQQGTPLSAIYLHDHQYGVKVFADKAFYVLQPRAGQTPAVVPFLLKSDATAFAARAGGMLATFDEARAVTAKDGAL